MMLCLKQRLKKTLILLLLAVAIIVQSGCSEKDSVTANQTTKLFLNSTIVEPPDCITPVKTTVQVSNVANMQAVAFTLQFNPTQLQVLDTNSEKNGIQIATGDVFSKQNSFEAINEVDPINGIIKFAVVIIGKNPINGEANLDQITWQIQQAGNSNLTFQESELADPDGNPISTEINNGVLNISSACSQ